MSRMQNEQGEKKSRMPLQVSVPEDKVGRIIYWLRSEAERRHPRSGARGVDQNKITSQFEKCLEK